MTDAGAPLPPPPDWAAIWGGYEDTKRVAAAFCTWVAYEMLITTTESFQLFANKPWSLSKILFVANRINTMYTQLVAMMALFWLSPPVSFCHWYVWLMYIGSSVTSIVVGLSLMGRVYALWNQQNRVIIPASIIFVLYLLSFLITIGYSQSKLTTQPFVPPFTGCMLGGGYPRVTLVFYTSLVFETMVIVLILVKSWPIARQRGVRTPLFTLLLEDGLAYYFMIMLAQLLGLLCTWVPVLFGPIIAAYAGLPVMGIACNRMFLRLQALLTNRQQFQESKIAEIEFWSGYVSGNPYIIGAITVPPEVTRGDLGDVKSGIAERKGIESSDIELAPTGTFSPTTMTGSSDYREEDAEGQIKISRLGKYE